MRDDADTYPKVVAFHTRPSTVRALHRLADTEERSPSSMAEDIVRRELLRRGFLKLAEPSGR
jgi:hypothetical protein